MRSSLWRPPGKAGVLLVQQLVEPADQSDPVRSGPDCEQCPGDIRRGRLAGVVADRQPLSLRGEDDLGRNGEARQTKRMHLRAGDGRPARLARTEGLVDRNSDRRRPYRAEAFRELLRRSARRIRFARTRVVDYLPGLQMTRNLNS